MAWKARVYEVGDDFDPGLICRGRGGVKVWPRSGAPGGEGKAQLGVGDSGADLGVSDLMPFGAGDDLDPHNKRVIPLSG